MTRPPDRIPPSSDAATRRMKSTRRTGTRPELELLTRLRNLGLDPIVNAPIEGTRRSVDLLFPAQRVAVFVDGCFWHGCPEHATSPKANGEEWRKKLASNGLRDRSTDQLLRERGWAVVRVWEHDVGDAAATSIGQMVAGGAGPTNRLSPHR
jgi:DNA mismatch endonuclease, patch repair protein